SSAVTTPPKRARSERGSRRRRRAEAGVHWGGAAAGRDAGWTVSTISATLPSIMAVVPEDATSNSTRHRRARGRGGPESEPGGAMRRPRRRDGETRAAGGGRSPGVIPVAGRRALLAGTPGAPAPARAPHVSGATHRHLFSPSAPTRR